MVFISDPTLVLKPDTDHMDAKTHGSGRIRIRNPAEYSRTIILCKILLKIWQRLNTDDLGPMKGAIEKMEGIKKESEKKFYFYTFFFFTSNKDKLSIAEKQSAK